jgi:hypothetical protein
MNSLRYIVISLVLCVAAWPASAGTAGQPVSSSALDQAGAVSVTVPLASAMVLRLPLGSDK